MRWAEPKAKFNKNTAMTIGIDFKQKSIEIDGKRLKLQIVSVTSKLFFVLLIHKNNNSIILNLISVDM
jgi:hypothetical protein